MPNRNLALIGQAQAAMHWNQRELAENMGTSLRTVARWQSGESHFASDAVTKLARHVHPVDRELAAQLLGTLGQTLLTAGFEVPFVPPVPVVESSAVVVPPPVPVVPAPVTRPVAHRDLIDAVVCSVADSANVAPKVVRPMVLFALRRAMEVGVDLDAAWKEGVLDGEGEVSVGAASAKAAVAD